MLSAMTKTDCILLLFNQEAFDLIIKEKLKKEKEELGKFVYNSLPKLKDFFSLYSVSSNVHVLFKITVSTFSIVYPIIELHKRVMAAIRELKFR